MRLIDADALVEEIKNKFPMGGTRGVFLAFVDDAPTAYDVENVVTELKEQKERRHSGILETTYYQYGIEDAIRIVKGM